uniref:Uncharacterized protein n=1 Tax=Amphimedon queenslandica TaxID=400682 RepID=A0A1X7ULY5_AMPQE
SPEGELCMNLVTLVTKFEVLKKSRRLEV